jgi:hypothetical protein
MRLKALFFLLLLLELCFGAAPFVSSLPYRHRAARAWLEFQQNPNPETERAWLSERSIVKREGLVFDAIIFVLLAQTPFVLSL